MRALFGVSVGLACLLPSAALATVMEKLSLADLADRAQVVVRGHVAKQECRWTKDARRIVTEVQISVDEPLKGSPEKNITVLQPGGAVGDIAQRVSGIASFNPQEQVLLFLKKRPESNGRYDLVGLGQGKWAVGRSQGQLQAIPPALDATLVDPASHQEVKPDRAPVDWTDIKKAVVRSSGGTP